MPQIEMPDEENEEDSDPYDSAKETHQAKVSEKVRGEPSIDENTVSHLEGNIRAIEKEAELELTGRTEKEDDPVKSPEGINRQTLASQRAEEQTIVQPDQDQDNKTEPYDEFVVSEDQ